MEKGKLYLIPVPLGDSGELPSVLPASNSLIVNSIQIFVVENEKTARRHLKQMGLATRMDELILHTLNEQTPPEQIPDFLKDCMDGKDTGLLSEAGCPAVADPGSELVKRAHEKNIQVIPLVGPSSILLALMASGMNGQNFCFNGYLPKEQKARIAKLRELERQVRKSNQTQIFIETPYRNSHVIEDAINTLSADLLFCIACNLTQPDEVIKTLTVSEWKKQKPDVNKRPAIFLVGK